LRGVRAAWIKDQRVRLENGQIVEYQVNMEVTFVLED
jgi:dodecin